MSAWPEAVWIIREMQKAIGANDRIKELDLRLQAIEHRYLIIAAANGSNPDPTQFLSVPSEGSLWMVVVQ